MNENEPLKIAREINAPVARVWQALTDAEDLKQWLPFLSDFKAEVGFKTQFMLGRDPDHRYKHLLEVTEAVERKKLTYSWRYDGYVGNSLVSFELFPDGEKTRLELTHVITEPFPADNPDFQSSGFTEGWTNVANSLKVFAEK